MPSSTPSARAATILPTSHDYARKAARRSFNCATSSAKPAPWSRAPARSRRRSRRSTYRWSSTTATTWRSPRAATAVGDARKLLGRDAIIGLAIKTVAEAQAAPVDLIDYVGSGGVYVTLSK